MNPDRFFEDVESVKEDQCSLEELYRRLVQTNEETKTVHDAETIQELQARIDGDVKEMLHKAKEVEAKLQALDRANAADRKLPDCGPGSSADCIRMSAVSELAKKWKDLMDDFEGLRTRIIGEKDDEQMIQNLISSPEKETFLQQTIQDQGTEQIIETVPEVEERYDTVKDIEQSLLDTVSEIQARQEILMKLAALNEEKMYHN